MNGSTAYAEGFQAPHRVAGRLSRARMTLLLLCLLLASCLALAVASIARAAPIPPEDPRYLPSALLYDENSEVTAEYSGTITQEKTFASGAENDTLNAKLAWKLKVTGPVDQIEYSSGFGPRIHWQLEELTGEVTDKGVNSSKNPFSCKGTFTPNGQDPGVGGVELPLDEPGFPASGGNPETNPDYSVIPPNGIPLFNLESTVTGETGGDASCSRNFWNQRSVWGGPGASKNESAWHDVVNPTVYFPPGGKLTKTLGFTCSKITECPPLNAGEKFNVTLNSSIIFTSPGVPPLGGPIARETPASPQQFGPPVPFDWLPLDKRNARSDLDPALENARNYCTPYALGLLGFGTGVLLAGAPTVATALVVSGSLTAFAAEPFCVATLTRVAKDIKRYRDPPDLNFHVVAHPAVAAPRALPSCGRWRGATLSFCKRLRAQETRWIGTAQEVAAIEEALETTTNRESAALTARDNAGIALQSAAGQALEARQIAALAAKNAAGKEMAATLRRAGIRFRLSRAQSKQTIKAVERALAKRGVSAADLKSFAGGALKPGAVDLLAALGR